MVIELKTAGPPATEMSLTAVRCVARLSKTRSSRAAARPVGAWLSPVVLLIQLPGALHFWLLTPEAAPVQMNVAGASRLSRGSRWRRRLGLRAWLARGRKTDRSQRVQGEDAIRLSLLAGS